MVNIKRKIIFGILIVFVFVGFVQTREISPKKTNESIHANLDVNLASSSGFLRADGSHIWDFPSDFGPHPDYQTEWWYYTGNLATSTGRKFGYQLTFFRRGLIPAQDIESRASRWGGDQIYMGHFAISDIDADEHYSFERISRGAPGLAGSKPEPFKVWLENWEVIQISQNEWWMTAEQDGVEIVLGLSDNKGVIFHGMDGYSQKAAEVGNASYYFSQPRLASKGFVIINNNEFPVTGLSWMDHEFSTSALSEGQVGWDWFSLQLDDGTEVMVFQIRQEDGSIDPFSSGTLIRSNGDTQHVDRSQFEIEVVNTWRSPHSDAVYPASWIIRIPEFDLTLDIEPYMSDQELNVSYAYWEGAVGITGMLGEQVITGSGYVELTGYAASMEGEF